MKTILLLCLIFFSMAQTVLINGDVDVLWEENLPNVDIVINSVAPKEISYFTTHFTTDYDYKLVSVDFSIPMIGSQYVLRYNFLLRFDDEIIYSASFNPNFIWNAQIIHLKGYKKDLSKGNHFVKLFVSTNSINLRFPHHNTVTLEHREPRTRSCMLVTGFRDTVAVDQTDQASAISMKLIHNEIVEYKNSIGSASTSPSEIRFYTRTFTTNIAYKLVNIEYMIPLVGNDSTHKRSKIIIYLDGVIIYSGTILVDNANNYMPIYIKTHKKDLAPGYHTLKLFTAADGGTLYIPRYEPLNLEGNGKAVAGRIIISGFT